MSNWFYEKGSLWDMVVDDLKAMNVIDSTDDIDNLPDAVQLRINEMIENAEEMLVFECEQALSKAIKKVIVDMMSFLFIRSIRVPKQQKGK